MRKYIIIIFIFVLYESSSSQSIFVAGSTVLVKYQHDILVLKDLKDCCDLRGYAVLDSENIFLAYDPRESAEASTIISIYNLKDRKESLIREIGGTGESYFSYNPENGNVVFLMSDGVYIFKLYDRDGRIIKDIEIKLINNFNGSGIAAWLDVNKLVLFKYTENTVEKEYIEIQK